MQHFINDAIMKCEHVSGVFVKVYNYLSRLAQELMRRKERPTAQYSTEQHLHLNDSNTFLIRSDAQVGNFPVWLFVLLYI